MKNTPSRNNTGRPSQMTAEYMIIGLGYSVVQLFFPIEDGIEFMKAYSKAKQYKENYNEPDEITNKPTEIRVKYLTAKDVADIQFAQTMGVKPDDKD